MAKCENCVQKRALGLAALNAWPVLSYSLRDFFHSRHMKMGPIGCPETSERNYPPLDA